MSYFPRQAHPFEICKFGADNPKHLQHLHYEETKLEKGQQYNKFYSIGRNLFSFSLVLVKIDKSSETIA